MITDTDSDDSANVDCKVMYEGKHIHFSEDQKPLCSCSTKVCKQRRLNGYAFCIRHILEDKSAPYYQCEFVNRYNGLPCTNPIRKGGDSKFCVSHLQVLGLVPKKGKKSKASDASQEQNSVARAVEPPTKGREDRPKVSKEKKKKDKHKRKHEKHRSKSKSRSDVQIDLSAAAATAAAAAAAHPLGLNPLESLLRQVQRPTPTPSESGQLPPAAGATNNGAALAEPAAPAEKPKKKSRSSRHSSLQDRMRDKLEKNKVRLKLQREVELQARLQQQPAPTATTTAAGATAVANRQLQSPEQCTTSPAAAASSSSLDVLSSGLPQPSPCAEQAAGHLPRAAVAAAAASTAAPPHSAHSRARPAATEATSLPFAVTNLPPLSASVVQAKTKKARTLYTKKLGLKSLDSLREAYQKEEERRLDLFPLGLEYSSDEEDIDQGPFLTYTPRFPDCSSSCSSASSPDRRSRQDRLEELSGRLRSQCACLVQSDRCHRTQRLKSKRLCLALIKAAREHSFGTVVSLLGLRRQSLTRPKVELPPDRTCVCKEESGEACQEEVLPYSSHCYRHILEDEHQELFHQCSAEFPGGFRCIEPAFDMQNDNPLCLEHCKRMRLQPKQKKPRKKTKPSALTRPNKKKKVRRNVRPQKPIPPAVPQSNSGMPPSFSMAMPRLSLSEVMTEDLNLDLGIDTSDLRMASDADNSDLNSEAGGSDLSEILPKLPMDIPDLGLFEPEEFTKFVKEHEEAGKNGDSDYMPIPMPTKEEQEELERAILEVSKTVNSVQESLDQLSKQSIDPHLSTDNAMFDDHDNSGDSADPDGMDGLPRDLQSAANRLLQDTMRQNSVEAAALGAAIHHPVVDLANSVPSSILSVVTQASGPLHVLTSVAGQGGFHDNGGPFGGVEDLMGQGQGGLTVGQLSGQQQQLESLRLSNPVLLGNGLVPMSSAMLNLQRQMANSPQSPHGNAMSPHANAMSPHANAMSPHANAMSPHHVLAPHGGGNGNAAGAGMLQQPRTLAAGQPSPMHGPAVSPATAPGSAAVATSTNGQHMTLPSFRQTWSVAPSPTASMLSNANLLGLIGQHSPDSAPAHAPNHHAPTGSLYPQMAFPQKLGFPPGVTGDSALAKTLGLAFNANSLALVNSAGQNHLGYASAGGGVGGGVGPPPPALSNAGSTVAPNATTKASTVT